MKAIQLLTALYLAFPMQSLAEPNPNPTNDPDVQRGYDEHQKEQRQKDTKEDFTVHTSGEGHGGTPTSGGFDPPSSDTEKDAPKDK